MLKKQTVFFFQTADVWSTSSTAEVYRCGPQTADILPQKKQTAPYSTAEVYRCVTQTTDILPKEK